MKTFSQLFSESWKEYKDNFKVFLKIFLLFSIIPALIIFFASIPLGIEMIQQGEGFNFFQYLDNPFNITLFIIILITSIISFFLYVLMQSSYTYNSVYRKKQMNFLQTLQGGKKYFWRYFLLLIVLIIFLMGLSLLLIIPGIMFLVYWIFASYILIKEDKGIIESLRTSYYMVKGKWWTTFGYVFLFILVMILISLGFGAVGGIFNLIISLPLLTMHGFLEGLKLITTTPFYNLSTSFVSNIFQLASNLITIPLTILFFKNLYLEYGALKKKNN